MPNHLKTVLVAMWIVAGVAVGGVIAAATLRHHAGPATADAGHAIPRDDVETGDTLKPIFDTKPFKLTDQDGRPFDSAVLRGKVWVADFVYTTCTSFCPQMTAGLTDVQQETVGLPVQFVSFTVDPTQDTPAVLKQYATLHNADPVRWHFLTGSQPELWAVSRDMELPVGPGDSAMQVMHSSHYLLVDRRGRVRGLYDFKNAGYVNKIVADAKHLLAEPNE